MRLSIGMTARARAGVVIIGILEALDGLVTMRMFPLTATVIALLTFVDDPRDRDGVTSPFELFLVKSFVVQRQLTAHRRVPITVDVADEQARVALTVDVFWFTEHD
jgi:hypothetical protein